MCLSGGRWTGWHRDVRLDTHRDSLSTNQLHLLTKHTQIGHTSISWENRHTHTHSPRHQTRGCRSHQSESAPSWCWTKHPECPAETTHNKEKSSESLCAHFCKDTLVFKHTLTLTTSSPSMILSFSRFSLRSSGRVLHFRSPSRPTGEETHTLNIFCSVGAHICLA